MKQSYQNTYKKILTIVVPIYNVEDFLIKCLDSIFLQFDNNYEIILVDDGSTDFSSEICNQYKLKYPQTIVIHKENGGLSDARNIGITIAKGEYIYFLDSDDWLAPNAIRTLLNFAINYNCEIVQGGFYYAFYDYLLYDNSKNISFILNREQAMKELLKNESIKNFAWGKIYKTEIVKKHLFIKGVYFEDSYWQHLIINEIDNYGVIPTPLYYYRQREESISGSFNKNILDLLRGYEARISFIEKEFPEMTKMIIKQYWKICTSILLRSKRTKHYSNCLQYWNYSKIKYKAYFDKYLNNYIRYRIVSRWEKLLVVFNFYDRIINKMSSNRFQVIKNAPK